LSSPKNVLDLAKAGFVSSAFLAAKECAGFHVDQKNLVRNVLGKSSALVLVGAEKPSAEW